MKKLFTLFLLGCAAATANAQQPSNSNFEEWKTQGNCGITYLTAKTSSSKEQNRPGVEPAAWSGSNINQVLDVTSLCTQGGGTDTEANRYVILKNVEVLGNKIPAYLTLGNPWVFAYGSGFAMMTYASMGDGGSCNGINFTNKPDALKFSYRRPVSTEGEVAHAIVYIWNGTYTSDVPYVCSKDAYTEWTTLNDVDRVILGRQTDGVSAQGQLIASADYVINGTTGSGANDWVEYTLPLVYTSSTATPEKMNIIFSAGDYWTRANLKGNSELHVDNVEFLYYSQLASLSYNGTAVANFDKDTYSYSIDAAYDESKLEATADGVAATIKKFYNKETGVLTLTVKGDDWSEENKNEHVYTIQFKTPIITEYTNSLMIDVLGGGYDAPSETTIQLI